MAQLDHRIQADETHPIDIAEAVALRRGWEFQRMADDQIAVTVRGQWRDHALTLAWSERDEMLRLISCFDLDPSEVRMPLPLSIDFPYENELRKLSPREKRRSILVCSA